ncbi:MAG: alpha/beta hydrolase [Nostoc sp.]
MYTPSRRADRQALRAALLLSATQDRQVSLIEIIKNYPTNEVQVEVDGVVYRRRSYPEPVEGHR